MSNEINYNKQTAGIFGWEPDWFGAKDFNSDLIKKIKEWQKDRDLTADGMCGPSTFRIIYNERISDIEKYMPADVKKKDLAYIVVNGSYEPIKWDKVVLWNEDNGLELKKGFTKYSKKREIKNFINHWDVCLSSKYCYNVLKKREISVHFAIDNDGTIYQFLDVNHAAWHAGGKVWNNQSIGVEISNAYYPKHQAWYKKNGFGERPLITDASLNGRPMKTFTGFYDVQIEALKALWEACHLSCDIPLVAPKEKWGLDKACEDGEFSGFASHYHFTKRKIDCAGLDIEKHLKELVEKSK